jgi:hypothetical protein
METNQVPDPAAGEIAAYNDEIVTIQKEGYELVVKKARNALFWAAGLMLFWEIIGMLRNDGFEPITFSIALALSGIFVGLALWTKKKPFTAIILGLVVFVAHWVLAIVSYGVVFGAAGVGKAIIGGIVVRIIILINLIRPLKDAKELQEMMEQKS